MTYDDLIFTDQGQERHVVKVIGLNFIPPDLNKINENEVLKAKCDFQSNYLLQLGLLSILTPLDGFSCDKVRRRTTLLDLLIFEKALCMANMFSI